MNIDERIEELKSSSRYPYTYAYDYIRTNFKDRSFSRSQVAQMMLQAFPEYEERTKQLEKIADMHIMLRAISECFEKQMEDYAEHIRSELLKTGFDVVNL